MVFDPFSMVEPPKPAVIPKTEETACPVLPFEGKIFGIDQKIFIGIIVGIALGIFLKEVFD